MWSEDWWNENECCRRNSQVQQCKSSIGGVECVLAKLALWRQRGQWGVTCKSEWIVPLIVSKNINMVDGWNSSR